MAKRDQLIGLIAPIVEEMGFILWGVEYSSSPKYALLRIYIDHADGIDVDQCSMVSRQVSAVLDVEDPIAGQYTLEVSSPGMARPLFTLEQCLLYVDEWVEVKLRRSFEGRKKFKGVIISGEDDELVIQVDDEQFIFPMENIEKARLIPNFDK